VRGGTRSRKAAELMVKHRAKNLTYKTALKNFGFDQKMETLETFTERTLSLEVY
jgi:hypothetical protein